MNNDFTVLSGDLSAHFGNNDLIWNSVVERHDHGALTRFALTPLNQTGSVGRIVLGFSGGVPIEFLFETAMDRQTIIRLFDVSLDDIDAKVYDFKMPERVDVIDDRAGVN